VENWLRAMPRNSQTRPNSSQRTHGLAFLRVRLILTGQQSKFDFDQQGGDHGSTEEAASSTKSKVDNAQ
jgi:hypothetical protein